MKKKKKKWKARSKRSYSYHSCGTGHLQTWDMPTLEMVGPTRCYTPSCVLLLFIFFLPYIESFAVSESRLPSSLVPVSVVPVVPSFPLLLVSPVLPFVLAPGGLAGVLPLALPQPLRPVSLVPAAISKLLIVIPQKVLVMCNEIFNEVFKYKGAVHLNVCTILFNTLIDLIDLYCSILKAYKRTNFL